MRLPAWTPADMSITSLFDSFGDIDTKPSKRVDYFIDNNISTEAERKKSDDHLQKNNIL